MKYKLIIAPSAVMLEERVNIWLNGLYHMYAEGAYEVEILGPPQVLHHEEYVQALALFTNED